MKPVIKLPNNEAPIWERKRLDQPRDSATSATSQQKPGTTATSTPLAVTGSSTAQNSPATGQQSEKCTGTTPTPVQSISEMVQAAWGLAKQLYRYSAHAKPSDFCLTSDARALLEKSQSASSPHVPPTT